MICAFLPDFTCPRVFCALRTLPGKLLEEIAAQIRAHSINALLVIGGFEVRHPPLL